MDAATVCNSCFHKELNDYNYPENRVALHWIAVSMLIYMRPGYIITEINISFGGSMFATFLKSTEHKAQPMMCLLFLLENERVFFPSVLILFLCKLSAGSF